MGTSLVTHAACLKHVTPDGHPECVARLEYVLEALSSTAFADLDRKEATSAQIHEIMLAHPGTYVRDILGRVPESGFVAVDDDSFLSPGSGDAALHAAGAVITAIDAIMAGDVDNAFCAIRPPGHHAEPNKAMGFCFFNNIAVGAHHARMVHGLHRIAVVDFDVHHGNGTQAIFEAESTLFYASSHQFPLYPGTGHPSERGLNNNIINIGLPPSSSSGMFRDAIHRIIDQLQRFQPEMLMISAGFDGHRSDPLAGLLLDEEDFYWATTELTQFAKDTCHGRVVSALEGGYDLDALAASTAAHVEALMNAGARN